MDDATKATFAIALKAKARIKVSGETGEVIARAEYTSGAQPSYLLRYASTTGAKEEWWGQDALEAVQA